jgi:hypothetical protein
MKVESEMQRLAAMVRLMLASPDQQISLTNARQSRAIKQRCTTGKERRITRWEQYKSASIRIRTPCASVVRRPSIPLAR